LVPEVLVSCPLSKRGKEVLLKLKGIELGVLGLLLRKKGRKRRRRRGKRKEEERPFLLSFFFLFFFLPTHASGRGREKS
jgi:hypothetical protein